MRESIRLLVMALVLIFGAALPLQAAEPFARGWTLDPASSTLRFQSVKIVTKDGVRSSKVEQSTFAAISGTIDEDGLATFRVSLDSIDTGVDLRNVRMRFLFFETFTYPEAVVTTRIDPAQLADLGEVRRKLVPLSYTLDLHGVKKEGTASVVLTLLGDDRVSVASEAPVSVAAADHNLDLGITKLQEAASVELIPSTTVTFDFTFRRNGSPGTADAAVAAAPVARGGTQIVAVDVAAGSTALEAVGDFDREACLGRFEILSKTDSITFRSGSARLDGRSDPILATVLDIVNRCPAMRVEVAGHTDADGSAATNQSLSEARAKTVGDYLVARGVPRERIATVGYGEARPAFPNDTENKWRNRRIEFSAN